MEEKTSTEDKGKKTTLGLDLFFKKISKRDLPRRDARLFRANAEYKKTLALVEQRERELEEARAPIWKAIRKDLGLTDELMKDIASQNKKTDLAYRSRLRRGLQRATTAPSQLTQVAGTNRFPGILCKNLTIKVCQHRVCVDQPVPLPVDRLYVLPNSEGTTISLGNDQFSYDDIANGYSAWNASYHRFSDVHTGGITIESGVELVEPATIRQIGLTFEPLHTSGGLELCNGIYGWGSDMGWGYPSSRFRGSLMIKFRVDYKAPNGSWAIIIDLEQTYKELPWTVDYVNAERTYPPALTLDLNTDFLAGSQFSMMAILSYRIEANGDYSGAGMTYNLKALPYMNLQACSMEWPKSVTVNLE